MFMFMEMHSLSVSMCFICSAAAIIFIVVVLVDAEQCGRIAWWTHGRVHNWVDRSLGGAQNRPQTDHRSNNSARVPKLLPNTSTLVSITSKMAPRLYRFLKVCEVPVPL